MFSSVPFSRSVVSDSLQPHGLQHAKLPRPSPTPGTCKCVTACKTLGKVLGILKNSQKVTVKIISYTIVIIEDHEVTLGKIY